MPRLRARCPAKHTNTSRPRMAEDATRMRHRATKTASFTPVSPPRQNRPPTLPKGEPLTNAAI